MLGYVVYAEETTNTNIGENGDERDEFRNGVKGIRDEVEDNKKENKTRLEEMFQLVKEKREEYKKESDANKEQYRLKVVEMKANYKEGLKNIKNEDKKISVEKIVDRIQELNTKTTDNLSDKIDQIENVLVSIKSRIDKAENKGLDVSSVKIEVGKAEATITLAREAISAQAKKVYEVNITDEANLKTEMKNLRDTFSNDIKAVHAVIKVAHVAVRDTATTLAKIPKIDDDAENDENEVTNEVEDDDNTTNND